MKNQYFGNRRDYFKYYVLEQLATNVNDLQQLTCLWMLTPPDGTGQGHVRFVPDPELPQLTAFFRAKLRWSEPTQPRVGDMAVYFEGRPFRFFSYRDDRDDFGPATRSEYFDSVPDEALQRAVLFFDPNNPVEVPAGQRAASARACCHFR